MIEGVIKSGRDACAWPEEIRHLYKLTLAKRIHEEGPFQLILGLLFGIATLSIDALVAPQILRESSMLRVLAVAPLTLLGLMALSRNNTRAAAACIGLSMIAFGVVMIHLSRYFPPDIASRYLFGIALLPSFANIVLPLTPRALLRFDASFAVTTCLAITVFLPEGILGNLDIVAAMIATMFATYQIVLRQEQLRQRNFLLDLQSRVTTVELIEANKQLQHLSERDPLTSLPNRRFFEQEFENRFALPNGEAGATIALMMIDLDHFKLFNDRHGHQAGDQCLRLVGVAINGVLREEATCFARYGGEEFVLVMRESRPDDAQTLARRICDAVANLPGRTGNLPLITTSIGVAVAPVEFNLSREELTEMADAALYAAKRSGRNRFEVVEAGSEPEALSA